MRSFYIAHIFFLYSIHVSFIAYAPHLLSFLFPSNHFHP